MIIGVMEINFKINSSYSLKDKRKTIRSLIEKIRKNFNVSISETDNNDIINFSTLGVSMVSKDNGRVIESVFDKIISLIEGNPDVEIISFRRDFL